MGDLLPLRGQPSAHLPAAVRPPPPGRPHRAGLSVRGRVRRGAAGKLLPGAGASGGSTSSPASSSSSSSASSSAPTSSPQPPPTRPSPRAAALADLWRWRWRGGEISTPAPGQVVGAALPLIRRGGGQVQEVPRERPLQGPDAKEEREGQPRRRLRRPPVRPPPRPLALSAPGKKERGQAQVDDDGLRQEVRQRLLQQLRQLQQVRQHAEALPPGEEAAQGAEFRRALRCPQGAAAAEVPPAAPRRQE